MKKIAFLLLASLTIGIYYLWEAEKLAIPAQFKYFYLADVEEIEDDLPQQVPVIKSKNRMEAEPSYVPHEQMQGSALSCASCHRTLERLGTSSFTCLSCHDGTMGLYNVNKDKGESAFHITQAYNGKKPQEGASSQEERTLTCSNCHNPHGSYSDRLLHNNPFGTAHLTPEKGGSLAKGKVHNYSELVKNYNFFKGSFMGGSHSGVWFARKDGRVEDTKIPIFMFVRGSGQQLDLVQDGVPASATAIMVYQYMERPATDRIPYRRGYYIPAKLPWLYGFDYGSPQNHYWTRFFSGESASKNLVTKTTENGKVHYQNIVDAYDEQWNKHVVFNYRKGFVYATDSTLDPITSGEVAQSQSVILNKVETTNFAGVPIIKTNLEELSQFQLDQESIQTPKGAQLGRIAVALTSYCSSCHLSYIAGETTGKFSFAHRNFIEFEKWNCMKCHYGHKPSAEGKQ